MEGHSLISADILASYAADAALEIDGVSRLVEGTRPRHHGVKITNADGVVAVELHLGVDWGVNIPAPVPPCRPAWRSTSSEWPI